MERIYKYNPDASYKPNGGTYPQLINAKDLYIQNITVMEHDGHSNSFQVKFPNVFTHYPNDAVSSCRLWHGSRGVILKNRKNLNK